MVGEGIKTSETESDKFEVVIRDNLEKFLSQQKGFLNSLEVSRYEGSDTKFYSDVKVTNPANGKNVWIEVKKNKYANLGGPSFKYKDGEWTCTTTDENDPVSQLYLDALKNGSEKFISFCREYLKTDDISLPKDLSPELIDAWKKSGSVDDTDNDVQFITDKVPLEDFGQKIAEYYKTAKYEPVYYMQVDDELYIIDPEYNPLGLKTKDGQPLKTLADAYRIGRIQFRAKGIDKKLKGGDKYYYSIVCDVKILADDEKEETEYNCSFKTEDKFPIAEDGEEGDKMVKESIYTLGTRVILEDMFDNTETNEFGERETQLPPKHWVRSKLDEIARDCQADPDEEFKEDGIRLGDVAQTAEGHYIATLYGGCNGGGSSRKLVTYLAVVKKFAKRLIDEFGHVWLVDLVNDCADDTWTLRIAFETETEEDKETEEDVIRQRLEQMYADDESLMAEADQDIGGEKSDAVPETGVKIWIDDVREAPEGFVWIKSVNDFIDWCYNNGFDNVTLVDTDHDAGDFQAFGGDYVRCFDYLETCGCENVVVHIHSANPVGANNIRAIITRNKDRGWKEIRNS